MLEVVLAAPEQILEEDDLSVFQARYAATNGKTYLLRAYVNSSVEPARVVTVYRTSKIEKYWRPG
ncbi:gsr0562 [Gloeobacter violaceus PCC 7421]|uniref:Gsr0562 protein n=1 Tax=Gloeobacter violaceus (strain ATCC 29082 / PCC 7421) TaxID=251221 RepID=Q7NN52_GLOVI|nr:gsr0562 [Gloeobacter violaceus PCC 7421]